MGAPRVRVVAISAFFRFRFRLKRFPGAATVAGTTTTPLPLLYSRFLRSSPSQEHETRATVRVKKTTHGGGERGRQPRRRRGTAPDEPHGDAAAHRPLPVHHGLRLLEGRQAPRPRSVSPEPPAPSPPLTLPCSLCLLCPVPRFVVSVYT